MYVIISMYVNQNLMNYNNKIKNKNCKRKNTYI